MKSVLFTFEDDSTRDLFLLVTRQAAVLMINSSKNPDGSSKNPDGFESMAATRENSGKLILSTLDTAQFDPPIKAEHERQSSLWVAGQKLTEGKLSDMQKQFTQECDAHSASVVLKEYIGGEWHEIRARRPQR